MCKAAFLRFHNDEFLDGLFVTFADQDQRFDDSFFEDTISISVWTFEYGGDRRLMELCPTKLSMVTLGFLVWSTRRTWANLESHSIN